MIEGQGLAVIALGGNAILRPGEEATFSVQMRHLHATIRRVVSVMDRFSGIVITHGNGPQVGDILLQNEMARAKVPPMPLDVCVAQSQGQIGYMVQLALMNELRRAGVEADVICALTAVTIGPGNDEGQAIKPIGPYYSEQEAVGIRAHRGWEMVEDKARGGYRRVVPSPPPSEVLGIGPLGELVKQQGRRTILVAGGGGGVPLRRKGEQYSGIEAVIDKDLTSALIARRLSADMLIMLTDIEAVYKGFRTMSPLAITKATPVEMMALMAEGQFPAGTMGPKVMAACGFADEGGKALITDADHLPSALEGLSGTTIVKER
jgi:carbamate kinase